MRWKTGSEIWCVSSSSSLSVFNFACWFMSSTAVMMKSVVVKGARPSSLYSALTGLIYKNSSDSERISYFTGNFLNKYYLYHFIKHLSTTSCLFILLMNHLLCKILTVNTSNCTEFKFCITAYCTSVSMPNCMSLTCTYVMTIIMFYTELIDAERADLDLDLLEGHCLFVLLWRNK